jgi:tripartite-type tricarboxylate transporter receptor subunit TctC
MRSLKLIFSALGAAALTALHPALAQQGPAQSYPSKPIRVIAAYPSGSGPDTVLRLVAERLTKTWGQQMVIENRPTGNGLIAGEAGKRAAPDGYTLLMVDNAHLSAHPHLYKQLPYDPVRDFDPVATLFKVYFFVVVPTNASWKSMTDLIASAKASPGKLTYGSWGVGSIGHLGGGQFEALTGTTMTHVPFQGVTMLYPAIGNRDVDWGFGSVASAGAVQRAGKVRFMAAAAPARISGFTDIPTIAESGGPADFHVGGWVALVAPRGTPPEIIAKVNAEVAKALAEPEVKEKLAAIGFEPFASAPAEITKAMEAESRRYADIIKRSNISLD